ncbi:MAG: 50S ribosomal protein L30 [Ruminococcaceae bacterium]|nr:50S ribosomal protein L30 [Oscillospiraceae bacterium]
MIKVTLVKSLIGTLPKQKATAASLGFKKIGDSIVLPDTDATKGKINVISHLVKVEAAE